MQYKPTKICRAKYKYGNLQYEVTILEDDHDMDWENDKLLQGIFYFVEYVEESLPSRVKVGGFKSFQDALEWANSQFGKLNWEKL